MCFSFLARSSSGRITVAVAILAHSFSALAQGPASEKPAHKPYVMQVQVIEKKASPSQELNAADMALSPISGAAGALTLGTYLLKSRGKAPSVRVREKLAKEEIKHWKKQVRTLQKEIKVAGMNPVNEQQLQFRLRRLEEAERNAKGIVPEALEGKKLFFRRALGTGMTAFGGVLLAYTVAKHYTDLGTGGMQAQFLPYLSDALRKNPAPTQWDQTSPLEPFGGSQEPGHPSEKAER